MSEPKELFPQALARWNVITSAKNPERPSHQLCYGGTVHLKKAGDHGLEVLREMAKFMNSRNMKPRKAIECAADAPNPQKYLANLAAKIR